jgi:hypothetical protein
MIKSEKKIKELAEILNKENNLKVTDAIELLRLEKPFEGAIGLLTACYDRTDDSSVKRTISAFMNDLKDQAACGEIIKEIRKNWKSDTISMLVSSCWQSGLNFAEYSLDLARVFLTGDYVTAIECLTVIEENVNELSSEQKNEVIKLIEETPFSTANEKSTLTFELLTILGK